MKSFYLITTLLLIISCTTSKREILNDNEYQIVHYKNDSIKHGSFKVFHKNGTIQRKMKFKNNLLHGKMTSYHPNGKKSGYYFSKKNILNGPFKFFYPNGNLKIILIYKNNNPDNIKDCYSPKNEILDCGTFKKGNGYVLQYDDNRHFSSKDYYLNGNYIKSDTII